MCTWLIESVMVEEECSRDGLEGGETSCSSYATLVALVSNHLYITIDAPVWSPAREKGSVGRENCNTKTKFVKFV